MTMTRDELEKEAETYTKNVLKNCNCNLGNPRVRQINSIDIQDAYLAGAEPREKQIEIDAEQIRALQKQNGELTDRVNELEAQIEKMKCCGNCKHCGEVRTYKGLDGKNIVVNCNSGSNCFCDKWEIKEK